jgi:hypothetical protein
MKHITSMKCLGLGITAFLANIHPLWAAEGAREDNSDLFVWIFLAFCALIVVAQLIPAMMMLLGFAKGIKKRPSPSDSETVDDLTSLKG